LALAPFPHLAAIQQRFGASSRVVAIAAARDLPGGSDRRQIARPVQLSRGNYGPRTGAGLRIGEAIDTGRGHRRIRRR